jgi:hypothetical protein
MEMAHDGLSFASFGEENSRSRLPGANDFTSRARKRPASANVRALFFLCKVILRELGRRADGFVAAAFRSGRFILGEDDLSKAWASG